MELDELRCVMAVADEGSMSRAADRLFVSQSALSRIVRRVELSVGARLFDRQAHGLSLTAAGAVFARRAEGMLAEFRTTTEVIRTTATDENRLNDPCTYVRIGMFFPSAAELTKPILSAFRRRYPAIAQDLVDTTCLGGERALLEGLVDVAFLWSPVSVDGVAAVTLFEDQHVALLGAQHPLSQRNSISADELADQPYVATVSMSSQWRAASMVDGWAHRPSRAVQVETVKDALRAVAAGAAVSIGPRSLQRYSPVAGIRCVPLQVASRPAALICHRPGDRREEIQHFVAVAQHVACWLTDLVPGAARVSPA